MKKKKIRSLFGAVVFILILGAAPNASAQYFPATRTPTPPLGMTINHGDTCTPNRAVSLDINLKWSALQQGKYKFRKGETPDLVKVPWQPLMGPSVPHTFISPNYGRKTVYMQLLVIASNSVLGTMSDSIDYKQSCLATRPSLRDLTITIQNTKYRDRFKFDVMYEVYGARTDHDTDYQIRINVLPALTTSTLSLAPPTTLNYTASQGSRVFDGIEYRRFTGILTVNAPASGELPRYSQGLNFNVAITGGPLILPSNPLFQTLHASKRILFEKVPYKVYGYRTECTGATGTGGNTLHGFGINPVIYGAAWPIRPTVLTLNGTDRSATAVDQEVKLDTNPTPFIGERGVRWVQLWQWDGYKYVCKIHWWCEGYSNKREGDTYAFRYTISTSQYRVRVP
jgi:hypothetical protein